MDYKTQNTDKEENINKLSNGKTWNERAEAAIKLGKSKDLKNTDYLLKALKSEKDEIVINRIIEALGKMKDPKATNPLTDLLKKELQLPEIKQNKSKLFALVESLIKIGDKKALEDIGILLESCSSDLKELSEKSLECIDPNWKENVKIQSKLNSIKKSK
ncbi:MAG TPA: HEAT repeat domain-containing protein [Candidatus Lokiarchaeia archaeon]